MLNVVLVEDHDEYRQQLQDLVQGLGNMRVVHACASDEAAIDWLRQNADGWHLLVLDMFLSRGHGFKVLRSCPRRSGQRVVFLTGYTREPAREQALLHGADAVFDKATGLGEFVRYLQQAQNGLAAAQGIAAAERRQDAQSHAWHSLAACATARAEPRS